jgi:hypothetical protein
MTDYIREALMYLKSICRRYGVTVIMVAHPTKAVTEKGGRTPLLSDIEGSMNWYNKCDNGLVVVRDFDKRTSRVISAKVREHGAGRIGVCHFTSTRTRADSRRRWGRIAMSRLTEAEIEAIKERVEAAAKDAEEAAFTLEMWIRDYRRRCPPTREAAE